MEQKKISLKPHFSSRISSVPPGEKQTKEQDVCGGGESETEAWCSLTVLNTGVREWYDFKGIHLKWGLNSGFIFPVTLCSGYASKHF